MQIDRPFIRLPLRFDATRLAEEISRFAESDWRPHPEGHPGNSALPLVAVGGDPNDDGVKGVMRATPHLLRAPYLRQVLAALRAPIGRTRLMRLDGNSEATPHVDTNYYWFQRARVHVPIVTEPGVQFLCGDESVHMAAGEAWVFDTWRRHNVLNPNPTRRIHLVADTAGSPEFRALLAGGTERFVPFDSADMLPRFEVHNFPAVMAPEEQSALVAQLGLPVEVRAVLDELRAAWRALFAECGISHFGRYRALLEQYDALLTPLAGRFFLANRIDAVEAARQIVLRPALNPELAPREAPGAFRFDRPIFIVSSPRSGSTLLFETLAQSPTVFTIGGESHQVIEGIPQLHPSRRGWESNRLTAADASIVSRDELYARFAESLRDRDGGEELPRAVRMLEKTPKNSLRIPFLKTMFPDALFIYLYRDPRATMSSMLDAWRSNKFATYPALPGWTGHPWSLLLVPGWRSLIDKPLAEIVAHQWTTATRLMLDDLEALPSDSWCVASYDRLVEEPQQEIARLCEFTGIAFDRVLTAPLPHARHTLTPPSKEKWRRNANELESVASLTAETAERAREVFARPPAQRVRVSPPTAAPPAPSPAASFRSIHTASFPALLTELRSSLVVSTYQSGRLVMLRADGGALNTHFRGFRSPMGVAVAPGRVALATMGAVWDYRDQRALSERIHPAGKHDAVFVPRNMHATGDIRVHEIAFDAAGELWITNTRFSALCTLDADHSFVPRWRPPFVTHLAAEDRCHLNGLCMIDGRPRYVTAFGATNTQQGWREEKTTGGLLIDVDSGEIVARGLSMPHSPRWYAGRLFVLESAKGTLATIDLPTGRVETIAELPGFTRGLAFAGPYAFIGLSQVRESVFEGIPLSQRLPLADRACGVWAVDLRTARPAAFVRFEGAVQELFDVQLLHGITYPELLEPDAPLLDTAFTLPNAALAEVAG